MRRMEQIQGLRLMKFDEVFGRHFGGDLSQREAAEILGVSERTFRRWLDRYVAEGAEGFYDRRLGRALVLFGPQPIGVEGLVAQQGGEHAVLGPTPEALKGAVPVAQIGRQIAPRRAGAHAPENRFQKPSIVRRHHPVIAGLARQTRCSLFLNPIRTNKTRLNDDKLRTNTKRHLELLFALFGNPIIVQQASVDF